MNGHTSAGDSEDELEQSPPILPIDNAELGITLSERKPPVECPSDWGDDPVSLDMIMIKDVKVGSEVSLHLCLFK